MGVILGPKPPVKSTDFAVSWQDRRINPARAGLTLVFGSGLVSPFLGAKFCSKHKIDHFWAEGIRSREEMRLSVPLPALFFPNSLRLLKGGICEAAAMACGNRPSAFARTDVKDHHQ
jgi:hypothetical protein